MKRKNRPKVKVAPKVSKRKPVKKARKAVKKVKITTKRLIRKTKPRIRKIKKALFSGEFKGSASAVEAQKHKAEETKYYPRPSPYMPPRQWEHEELPSGYGDNKIVLLVRDPYWLHSYWEMIDEKKMQVEQEARAGWNELRKVLRVYDVTGVNFNGFNANKYYDIDLTPEASNWYINVGEPNRSWCVDLGIITPDGKFILIARSNIVTTPRDGASDVIDEEWMSVEEDFYKLYGLWGGFAGASPGKAQIKKMIKERLQKELSSGAVSSFVRPVKYRGFWLVVNTELIVYGATEPDATVTVQGRPIKLNCDGTFSLRFALPNGEQVIPVKGISADKGEERTITQIVKKHTK